jgi:hypothetical protein
MLKQPSQTRINKGVKRCLQDGEEATNIQVEHVYLKGVFTIVKSNLLPAVMITSQTGSFHYI